jgi:glutathione S-transferase
MTACLKLYGVPLSQPFRSVAWTLLLRKVPFDIQLTVPGATSSIGSRNESFLSKSRGRTGTVPLLEVDESLTISESPAILAYLCEKNNWTDLYPLPATPEKTVIDSYMHWHHTGTRSLSSLQRPYMRPELNLQVTDEDRGKALQALESLNNGWLQGDDDYIASSSQPTIADLLCYEEIVQVTMTGALEGGLDDYPNIIAWTNRMRRLPYHGEVHTALTVLGNVVEPSETPIPKRLGAATKAGVTALKEAQETFAQG